MKGYVYLLLAVDQKGEETHKVGISKHHPELRVKTLQTGNANKISVLNFYMSENYKKVERLLHSKFYDHQTLAKNEWFKLSDKIVLEFLEECRRAEEIVDSLKENPFYQ